MSRESILLLDVYSYENQTTNASRAKFDVAKLQLFFILEHILQTFFLLKRVIFTCSYKG